MGYPLAFVSLGGISDTSYLNGHHYTYEGSTHGKIIESLIKARVMNPVFLFDELDKVSNTSRGDEIINTLIHITDPVQNDKFSDKYFEEIDLDLSKSLIIFTYNDENAINPILKDRMITIKVAGYNSKQKLTICKDYIIPELLPQYNMQKNDIIFDEQLLKIIIETHGKEEGVRNLKRVINDIISWINMLRYVPIDGVEVKFPFIVSNEFYNKYCKKDIVETPKYLSMYL
jgi:ATP-dependent Lon protease